MVTQGPGSIGMWRAASRSMQGGRNYQEDDCAVRSVRLDGQGAEATLAVLADGMGGHAGGATASSTAIRAFVDRFVAAGGPTQDRLQGALAAANDAIAEKSNADPALAGMGCTVVGLVAAPDRLDWISVGDSPLWIFSSGKLRRLNEDHSMTPLLQARVERGDLTAAAAAVHPARNALRSAVIGEDIPLIDLASMPMERSNDELLVLASDGLCTLSDAEIESVLQKNAEQSPERLAELLIEAVDRYALPDQDNTTVIVLRSAAA